MGERFACPMCSHWDCRGRCSLGFDAYYSRMEAERPLPAVDWDGDDRDDFDRFYPEGSSRREEVERW